MSERNIQRVVLFAFCLSGAAALIYEVAWTRALSLVLGSTVYSISVMLATFMAGLAIGAYGGGKIADRTENHLFFFGILEMGIGSFGLITVPLIYNLPRLYFWTYKSFHLNPGVYFVSQFLLCALIMIVPTTLMGATFPLVSKRITRGMEEMGRKVGDAYSANTLGAVLGSLCAGFVLVPLIGIKWASFAGGIINFAVAGVIVVLSRTALARALAALPVILALFGGVLSASSGIKNPKVNFYQAGRYDRFSDIVADEEERKVLMSEDYAQGHVIAYKIKEKFLIIQTGGKLEGTSPFDIPNTVMLAALPAAALPEKPESTLLIGLGAGVTAWAGKTVLGGMEVVEINPGVVEAVKRYGFSNVLDGVELSVADGRRYLMYADSKYDIIISGTSVPSEAMSANLFTREFYELVADRLKEGGIFCQHLPVWALAESDAHASFKTFFSVFPHANFWFVPSAQDIIMVGSKTPFYYTPEEVLERAMGYARLIIPDEWEEEMKADGTDFEWVFRVHHMEEALSLREPLLSDDTVPVITDDRPFLEFSVTKNLLLGKM